jgi:hypothetical protein
MDRESGLSEPAEEWFMKGIPKLNQILEGTIPLCLAFIAPRSRGPAGIAARGMTIRCGRSREVAELVDALVIDFPWSRSTPLCGGSDVSQFLLGSVPMILRIARAPFALPDLVGAFFDPLVEVVFHHKAPLSFLAPEAQAAAWSFSRWR